MQTLHFAASVQHQIRLLTSGDPLAALGAHFANDGKMYANNILFASGFKEAHAKQEPFVTAAHEIIGNITDLALDLRAQLCVFRNKTRFATDDDVWHQIDGLCWQQWRNGKIAIERYYDGDLMQMHLNQGLLANPALLT